MSADGVSETAAPQRIRALLELRELLLNGAFAPGERLSEIPLGERLGVSRTPLRLALIDLEHEGLLRRHRAGGYVVKGFGIDDVDDAIELRGVLEGTAARFAAERQADPDGLERLRDIVVETDAVVYGERSTEAAFADYVGLNEQFHAVLLALASSSVLVRSLEHATSLPFASSNAFVRTHAALPTAGRVLVVAQEQHRAIVDAIAAREGARAEALAREHARLARRNLADALAAGESLQRLLPGGALISVPDRPDPENRT